MQYRTYATGDQIWVRRLTDGREVTVKYITSDGLTGSEDENDFKMRKLTGIERALHYVVVAAIKFNHRLVG